MEIGEGFYTALLGHVLEDTENRFLMHMRARRDHDLTDEETANALFAYAIAVTVVAGGDKTGKSAFDEGSGVTPFFLEW